LDESDERLAYFAGKISRQVAAPCRARSLLTAHPSPTRVMQM
jgi:hypothetical protein